MTHFFIIAGLIAFSIHAAASYKVQIVRGGGSGTRILAVQKSRAWAPVGKGKLLRSLPHLLDEGPHSSKEFYQEYLMNDASVSPQLKALAERRLRGSWPGSEVKALVVQGPTDNRINLTIVGDGYRMEDKGKFFADAQRTSDKLFSGSTFASYLPLFNVFAVFVPSSDSGIGDGAPKNTALRLYRSPKGSKRAIMPGDESAAERALALAPATDYPILIANDNYYGGLGGRYAISTSSVRSGMLVLRHELGHNFGNVGEEYDGGYVYSGANSSRSPVVPWNHWVEGPLTVNEALNLGGEYMWRNLKGHPVHMSFKFPEPISTGAFTLSMLISSVGWETPNDVAVTLDNKSVKIDGTFNDDRNFYELGPIAPFTPGRHNIDFVEKIEDGDNVLAYVRIYALAPGYEKIPKKVGAYATFDVNGAKSYRPTHDSCLMRDMLTSGFCVVDKENMWNRFLDRVALVDDVSVTAGQRQGERKVTLKASGLPGLIVGWFKIENGREIELTDVRNHPVWKAPSNLVGKFKVKVRFATPEVRQYSSRFVGEREFSL